MSKFKVTSESESRSKPETEASLGDQELALLRYIAAHGAVSVGEVAEGFGLPQNLSRSTVVTVMERLRKKGVLTRKKQEDIFRYSCPVAPDELMGGVVRRFVEKTLAGSLSPFVRYFASADKLSPQEVAELERLLSKLQEEKPTEEKRRREEEKTEA